MSTVVRVRGQGLEANQSEEEEEEEMKCYSTLLCEHEERDITHYTGERTKKEAKQKQQETQN